MYKEAGVIINQRKNQSYTSGVGSYLPICVIGSGLSTIKKVFKVVKDSEAYSVIRDDSGNIVSFSSIIRIGNTEKATDYNVGTHMSDYSRSSQSINGVLVDVVLWGTDEGDLEPTIGNTFYAEVEVVPPTSHYDLKIMTSKKQVEDEYGLDVNSGTINNITLGALIALENTSMVYTLKVAKAGSTVTAAELQVGLDKLRGEKDAYRIMIADVSADDLNLAVVNHVRTMSDPTEGSERVTLLAKAQSASTASEVASLVGGYAAAIKDFRVAVVYPDRAKRKLSDGVEYLLTGQFVAIALASMKAAGRPEQAYTEKQILNFTELVGVKMTRAEKNLVAEQGVMILEQNRRGDPITVRHGISTDMSSIQMRELSVTELADYVSRVLRPVLSQYKGKNITRSLVTRIEGSVNSTLAELIKNGHILDESRVVSIQQLVESPDSIAIEILIKVPYPCNYITVIVSYD